MINQSQLAFLVDLLNRGSTSNAERIMMQAIIQELSVMIAKASKPIDITEAEVIEKPVEEKTNLPV